MTSETTTTPRGSGGHRADGSGYGLVVFAAILLFVLGFFNMLYGGAAIANSHVFVANAHFVVGNLRFWGWITLIIAVLQLAAAAGILGGSQLARWFGVALLGLNALDMMFFLPAYPFWSLTIIAVLQLAAAAGILSDSQLARWFGVALLGLNALDMMFFLPAYPFWSLTIIAIDVVALYGLCAYGSRANLAA